MDPYFKNGFSYIRFGDIVRQKFRFRHPPEVTGFLRGLVDSAEGRSKTLPTGFPLWRAQIGTDFADREYPGETVIVVAEPVPYSEKRMKPLDDSAREGRANPKGIPCLYLATDKKTAMSEVRPWLGAMISLGHFRTNRDLKVVDLSIGHDFQLTPDHLFGNLPEEELIKGIWAQVDKAFSTPVTDDPSTAEYVPTQVIAEEFHRAGYEGLVFRSSLSDGFNVVLFDLQAASMAHCCLQKLAKIDFEFSDAD